MTDPCNELIHHAHEMLERTVARSERHFGKATNTEVWEQAEWIRTHLAKRHEWFVFTLVDDGEDNPLFRVSRA